MKFYIRKYFLLSNNNPYSSGPFYSFPPFIICISSILKNKMKIIIFLVYIASHRRYEFSVAQIFHLILAKL